MKITVSNGKSSIRFICDKQEFSGVKKIADKVCMDVNRVTGVTPEKFEKEAADGESSVVVFGTLGVSKLIEKELPADVLNQIKGKREVYAFIVTEQKITIAGSDKRGTIYGLFHLSELMGVSPLVDWADILPLHQDCVEIENQKLISKEPSVRFRGFFINDEWPACGNWAKHNFGGFNVKMYEHVFELLLRLKGNYMWPAMWSGRFSDDGPGLANAELADELGVVMGASHHEPCCRAGEEYKYLRGPGSEYGDAWNFRSNEKGITKFWEDGLKRSGKFENVITVGMRGEADTAILKNATLADNIQLLRDVLKTQNSLIRKYVNPDLQKVPRMLALYKEVEPYFYGDKHTKGLMDDPELEGVTLMLCDDNHGNLRTVPTEKMRSHNGGYGMYYHFDYHGSPYSYEWFNTNYLPKVKEQMTAAYDFGIRDLWIVNVGDVMTNEYPLAYFLDLAYDYEKYSKAENTVQKYTKAWVEQQFAGLNDVLKDSIYNLINLYTKIANMRRTECLQPDTFHPVNFGESDQLLAQANSIISILEQMKPEIPQQYFPGFFLEVYLPAVGAMNVLRMQLYSGKNKWFASKSIVAANYYADKVRECYNLDQTLVDECDKVDGGKFFASGWSEHFGFKNWCEAANQYPTYTYVEPTRKQRITAWVAGQDFTTTGQDWTVRELHLDDFKNPAVRNAMVYVANCGREDAELTYTFEDIPDNWLTLKVDHNKDLHMDTLLLEIDRAALSKSADKKGKLVIKGNDGHGAGILVTVYIDAEVPACDYPAGTFVQTGNYISIEAEHFTALGDGAEGAHFEVLPEYGTTLSAVKAFPVINSYAKGKNAPYVEYKFALKADGVMSLDFFLNPSNPAYKDNKLQFIAEVNGEKILKDVVDENFHVGDNQEPWGTDVTNNIRISSVYADCKAGLNTLRVYPVTPNVVLEKIVIYNANTIMPDSYLGAPETYRK